MTEILIYTTPICPYCEKAKTLFKHKGIAFESVDVSLDHALRSEMTSKSGGRRTVPQIFINGIHIGGCDDLYKLDAKGELDPLLK